MAFPSPELVPPTLENFQWQFNGFTFGAGTAWGVLRAEGFDLATTRSGDSSWPRDHGQVAGLDLLDSRDLLFDLFVKTDGTSVQHAMLSLAAATGVLPNEELPLWFQLPTLPLMCVMCRVRKRPMKIDADYAAANVARPELVFHATDPRIYSPGHETALPESKPIASVAVTNLGNMEMRPILVLNGPITNPFVKNVSITGSPRIELKNPAFSEETFAAWKAATGYKLGDVVEQAGIAYVCIKAMTAEEDKEPPNATFWAVWSNKGEWKAATEYKAGAFVESGGFWYVCIKTMTAGEDVKPPEEIHWVLTAVRITKKEHEEKEEKGEAPTIKEKDQVLVDLGNPHLVQYYTGGIGVGAPVNIARWVTSVSTWWDLLTGENKLQYGSLDAPAVWKAATEYKVGNTVTSGEKVYVCIKTMTAGEDVAPPNATFWREVKATVQWASAWQL